VLLKLSISLLLVVEVAAVAHKQDQIKAMVVVVAQVDIEQALV
jgi:hypothetical protein